MAFLKRCPKDNHQVTGGFSVLLLIVEKPLFGALPGMKYRYLRVIRVLNLGLFGCSRVAEC
jgi:hypothetical protein